MSEVDEVTQPEETEVGGGLRCYLHPEAEARFACAVCGRALCDSCAVHVEGKAYCRPCLKEAVGGNGSGILVRGSPSPVLVFLFSLLPGAGHMYMGFMRRGLQLMVLFFGTIWLGSLSMPLGFSDLLGMLAAPVVWFYSFFDSLGLSGRLGRGEAVADRGIFAGNGAFTPATWGWVLVGIGGMLLLGNLTHLLPSAFLFWMRRTVPPLVLIALGAAILWHQKNRWGR